MNRKPLFTVERVTPQKSVQYSHDIVRLYKNGWLATYPSKIHQITVDDILLKFRDFDAVVHEWEETILQAPDRDTWIAKNLSGALIGF